MSLKKFLIIWTNYFKFLSVVKQKVVVDLDKLKLAVQGELAELVKYKLEEKIEVLDKQAAFQSNL